MGTLEDKCKDALKYWQKELKLSDWEFRLSFDNADILVDKQLGACYKEANMKRALIVLNTKIIKSKDIEAWLSGANDIEATLVHELLHCVIHSMDDNVEDSEMWAAEREVIINTIALALLKGHRVIRYEKGE